MLLYRAPTSSSWSDSFAITKTSYLFSDRKKWLVLNHYIKPKKKKINNPEEHLKNIFNHQLGLDVFFLNLLMLLLLLSHDSIARVKSLKLQSNSLVKFNLFDWPSSLLSFFLRLFLASSFHASEVVKESILSYFIFKKRVTRVKKSWLDTHTRFINRRWTA